MRLNESFESKISVWINFSATFIRMIVIWIFLFEQDTIENEITHTSRVFVILITIYMGLGVLSISVELIKLFCEIVWIFFLESSLQINDQKSELLHKVRFRTYKTARVTIIKS